MEITKEELKKIYYENKNSHVCKILGVTQPTLLRKLKESEIKLKGKGVYLRKLIIRN